MRSLPVGEHGLLVLVDDVRAAVAAARLVRELAADPAASGLAPPRDVVPAARTVLLDGLPGPVEVEAWRDRLGDAPQPSQAGPSGARDQARELTIETRYDGADLAVVAAAWRCGVAEVVERHQAAVFLVAFCGFAPGFAYCVPAEPMPEVPRREAPRERVPRGSVALAGEYCGVYPAAMPGGWQLVGTTTAVLFDPDRDRPALLVPGDTVRFRAAP